MILHVAILDKFIPPLIDFIGQHFNLSQHRFWLKGDKKKYHYENNPSIHQVKNSLPGKFLGHLKLISNLHKAEKVILHGLFDIKIVLLLSCMPWLLRKCYWVIWGGDLYTHETEKKDSRWYRHEWIRRFFISRLGHFITHIQGDYELAQKWYGAKGQWHECFMYTSNLYRDYLIEPEPHDGINILLGNSATLTNNHLDALEKLRPFKNENIKIYCPLSYGDTTYGNLVEQTGKKIFGEKFIPLRDFIPFEKYLNLLSDIDIAVFNHNRQQGMGNITTLLGLGKTVFMRKELTSFKFLEKKGVYVCDIRDFKTRLIKNEESDSNSRAISVYFSNKNLISQLETIFNQTH